MSTIKVCVCGCGETLPVSAGRGRPASYITGHRQQADNARDRQRRAEHAATPGEFIRRAIGNKWLEPKSLPTCDPVSFYAEATEQPDDEDILVRLASDAVTLLGLDPVMACQIVSPGARPASVIEYQPERRMSVIAVSDDGADRLCLLMEALDPMRTRPASAGYPVFNGDGSADLASEPIHRPSGDGPGQVRQHWLTRRTDSLDRPAPPLWLREEPGRFYDRDPARMQHEFESVLTGYCLEAT